MLKLVVSQVIDEDKQGELFVQRKTSTFRRTTFNHPRVNIKHFLGPILDAEVAQKRAPFPAVVTITEMGNANICILCDVVKKV